ncbi:uncharacterized protein MONOS_6524 [Monocercomonoides exilis]|uniref:uncharacterized protein n=1 Tax=Monocercomonoides exilis TaxID=2049356 RepID=UPI00355953D4|nr:hypothetical protein MONOS_6524 [Monocercomonoides exilis]|eukprot:MONOS_6524.1-p1 / transcript=MONOS_6524.1 / gene=MONOS_6524 / organism=Monocercomonoides_exilis_PA203 / gene_product=unspecified product / transcript_product=unspecified product / location=Mono_scaffold00206:84578-85772(-) / protein_length=352 / sequence_SO=supercontig / SO=protein_coding / is_pseudo=false
MSFSQSKGKNTSVNPTRQPIGKSVNQITKTASRPEQTQSTSGAGSKQLTRAKAPYSTSRIGQNSKPSSHSQLQPDIFKKIVPDFKPENIGSFFPLPEGRIPPINFPIEVPTDNPAHKFEVDVPTLFPTITHVSIVSYTILGVPLDSAGRPVSTSLNVCFPDLHTTSVLLIGSPRTPAALSSSSAGKDGTLTPISTLSPRTTRRNDSSPTSGGSGESSPTPHSSPPLAPKKITDLCINLPLTGVSTQCEYFPERVLHPDFAQLAAFQSTSPLASSTSYSTSFMPSSSAASSNQSSSSLSALSSGSSASSGTMSPPTNASTKRLRLVLLGCDGYPLTVQKLFLLLRVYGKGEA